MTVTIRGFSFSKLGYLFIIGWAAFCLGALLVTEPKRWQQPASDAYVLLYAGVSVLLVGGAITFFLLHERREKFEAEFIRVFDIEFPSDGKRRTIIQPYVNGVLQKLAQQLRSVCDTEAEFLDAMKRTAVVKEKATALKNLETEDGHEEAIRKAKEKFWYARKVAKRAGFWVLRKLEEYLALR